MNSFAGTVWILALATHWAALSTDIYKPQVQVIEQRGDIEPGSQPPRVRATVTFHNRLPIAVDSVVLGFAVGATDPQLQTIHPDTLYEKGPPPDLQVRAVQHPITVHLPASGVVTSTLTFSLPTLDFAPQAFLTHVLSYTVAELDIPTLLDLINSTASADQVAACNAFGLIGDATAKLTARKRWPRPETVTGALADVLRAPPPETPSQSETFRRVYAARALGVLGGTDAYDTLTQLAADPNMDRLDAPLQVLERARETGLLLQTPLAFALAPHTLRFHNVLSQALADVGPVDERARPPRMGLFIGCVVALLALLTWVSRRTQSN